jgi:hypothetical protein
MQQKQRQTYNDGLLSVYAISNIAQPGDMPVDGLTLRVGPLRFSKRTVGMTRFWAGQQSGARIDMLLRIPRVPGINTEDVVVLHDGTQCAIRQIQEPEDILPPSLDLSLEKRVSLLEFPAPPVAEPEDEVEGGETP